MAKQPRFGGNETYERGEVRFHYNRENRVKSLSPGVLRQYEKKGPFKRNPSLLIILLDIFILVIILYLFKPLIGPNERERNFHGFDLTVRAFEYEDRCLASLVVEARETNAGDIQGEAVFSVEGETVSIMDILPGEGERTFRATLPLQKESTEASGDIFCTCVVTINGDSVTLETKVIKEE
jgi:hypothetical protein